MPRLCASNYDCIISSMFNILLTNWDAATRMFVAGMSVADDVMTVRFGAEMLSRSGSNDTGPPCWRDVVGLNISHKPTAMWVSVCRH